MRFLVVLVIQYSLEPSIRQLPLKRVPAHCITTKLISSNVSFAYIAATPATTIRSALPAMQQLIIEFSMRQLSYATACPGTMITSSIETVFPVSPSVTHAQMLQHAPHVARRS